MNTNRIKVAYILTPITFGGAERVSLNFLRAVDRRRFDIRPIILIRPWEDELYFARELRSLGYSFDTVPVSLSPRGGVLRVPRAALYIYRILKKGGFDIVHTHGYFADICGQFVARLLGIRSVSTCHGFVNSDNKLRIYNFLDKLALRFCRSVIAVSDEISIELQKSGIKTSCINVLQNAVNINADKKVYKTIRFEKRLELGIRHDQNVVGYLGRLSSEKGLAFLVEAASGLRRHGANLKLVFVGDGPERQFLKQQVENLGLEKDVLFVGFQEEVERWISVFDVFVLPSTTEGTPLALLEAMALGVPVIATAVGGIPKVVSDRINGLLVPPGDQVALRRSILQLIEDAELRSCLVMEAKTTIRRKFDVINWCKKIEEIYC